MKKLTLAQANEAQRMTILDLEAELAKLRQVNDARSSLLCQAEVDHEKALRTERELRMQAEYRAQTLTDQVIEIAKCAVTRMRGPGLPLGNPGFGEALGGR